MCLLIMGMLGCAAFGGVRALQCSSVQLHMTGGFSVVLHIPTGDCCFLIEEPPLHCTTDSAAHSDSAQWRPALQPLHDSCGCAQHVLRLRCYCMTASASHLNSSCTSSCKLGLNQRLIATGVPFHMPRYTMDQPPPAGHIQSAISYQQP